MVEEQAEPGVSAQGDGVMFEDDAILPAQFFAQHRSRRVDGESRLMLALLEDAVNVLGKLAPRAQSGVIPPQAREVLDWLGMDAPSDWHRAGIVPFDVAARTAFPSIDPAVLRSAIFRSWHQWSGRVVPLRYVIPVGSGLERRRLNRRVS